MVDPFKFVLACDLGYERVVGIGVCEKGAERQKHLGDGQCGGPLVFQDVEAYGTVRVDVHVVYLGHKPDLGWFEGIVG